MVFSLFYILVAIFPQHSALSENDKSEHGQKVVARTVRLEGRYSFQLHPQIIGRVEVFSEGSFMMAIQSSNRWMISYTNECASTNVNTLYSSHIAICDATNIYVLKCVNPAAIPGDVVRWEGRFYHGTSPNPEDRHIYYIWFTFVNSPPAVAQGRGALRRPIGDISYYFDPRNTCQYHVLTNHANPIELEIVLEQGPTFLNRNRKRRGRLESASLPPPYHEGYTLGRGLWQNTMQFGDVLIPMRYKFTLFTPKDNGVAKDDLLAYESWSCLVTNATMEEIPRIDLTAAQLNEPVMVADHRFAGEGYAALNYGLPNLNYAAINQQAHTLRRISPQKTLEQMVLERSGFRTPTPQTRLDPLFRVFLYIMIASPLIAFLVSKTIKILNKKKGVHT